MTASTYRPLLDIIVEHVGAPMPDGCDSWGMRAVHPDLRSSNGFRYPFPGGWAEAPGPIRDHRRSCPDAVGDGICTATTAQGMASGGIPAITVLLTAHATADVLGDDMGKLRLRRFRAVEVVDLPGMARDGLLARADLAGADLSGASLYGASLAGAYLAGADLSGAYLAEASLAGADLAGAYLAGASLAGADLSRAYLARAYLAGADLSRAYLAGAYLAGADLSGAYLAGADLSGAINPAGWHADAAGYAAKAES